MKEIIYRIIPAPMGFKELQIKVSFCGIRFWRTIIGSNCDDSINEVIEFLRTDAYREKRIKL